MASARSGSALATRFELLVVVSLARNAAASDVPRFERARRHVNPTRLCGGMSEEMIFYVSGSFLSAMT